MGSTSCESKPKAGQASGNLRAVQETASSRLLHRLRGHGIVFERARARAERVVEDLLRLRKDEALFSDILGRAGTRIPITAMAANLTDPKDKGLKKALARVTRTVRTVQDDA